jgi:hypothetical protein
VFLRVGRVRRDHRLHAAGLNRGANSLRIVSRIPDEGVSLCVFEERFGDCRLVSMARCQFDVERSPFRVDDGVDFGGESTT